MTWHIAIHPSFVLISCPSCLSHHQRLIHSDDFSARPTPAVIRIAAYASVQLIDKYLDHLWDCEIYVITISKPINFYNTDCPLTWNNLVLCPDRKMAWFKDQKLSAQRIRQIKKIVIDRWNASYAPNEDVVSERTEDKKVCNILIDISS